MLVLGFLGVFLFAASSEAAVEAASQYMSVYEGGYGSFYGKPDSAVTSLSINVQDKLPRYWLLRFYIPPAVTGMTQLALFCKQTGSIGVVARLGGPPQCDLEAYSSKGVSNAFYNGLQWNTREATLQELRENDWRVPNGGGTISILKDYNSSSTLGEWLFIKVLFDGASIPNVPYASFITQVDPDKYAQWYSTVEWDGNGDPLPLSAGVAEGACDNFFSSDEPVNTRTYTIQVIPKGSGTVSPPSNLVRVNAGGSQRFDFTPLGGSVEKIEYGPADGNLQATANPGTFFIARDVQENKKLIVYFTGSGSSSNYRITVFKDGNGSVWDGANSVKNGGVVSVVQGGDKTLTFEEDAGWRLDLLECDFGDGKGRVPLELDTSYLFKNVQSHIELYVIFKDTGIIPDNYTIYVLPPVGQGTITPPGTEHAVSKTGERRFDFRPAEGWVVSKVSIGPYGNSTTDLGAPMFYTFVGKELETNMQLEVEFKEKQRIEPFEANRSCPIYLITQDGLGETVVFSPTLIFSDPPEGTVSYYVIYSSQGKLFSGREELDGRVVFELWNPDTQVPLRFGTYDFQGDTIWACDIFNKVGFKTELVSKEDVQFFLGVADQKDFLNTLQGARFEFQKAP